MICLLFSTLLAMLNGWKRQEQEQGSKWVVAIIRRCCGWTQGRCERVAYLDSGCILKHLLMDGESEIQGGGVKHDSSVLAEQQQQDGISIN